MNTAHFKVHPCESVDSFTSCICARDAHRHPSADVGGGGWMWPLWYATTHFSWRWRANLFRSVCAMLVPKVIQVLRVICNSVLTNMWTWRYSNQIKVGESVINFNYKLVKVSFESVLAVALDIYAESSSAWKWLTCACRLTPFICTVTFRIKGKCHVCVCALRFW